MNKKELITRICRELQTADIRKPVSIKSEKITVSFENGDSSVFKAERKDRRMLYTAADVGNILDMAIAVIEDAMAHGERVMLKGFGTFSTRRVQEHRVREPDSGIWYIIPEQYKVKFTAGGDLASAARSFGLQQDDIGAEQFLPEPDEEEDE